MKKFSPAFVLPSICFVIVFFSCKKINTATELGGSLIPGVDNVNTFEVSLNTVTKNLLTSDSEKVAYTDYVALGDINDPEFGHAHANFSVNFSASSYGSYPFLPRKDTIHTIDSVVLSLAYVGAYGDTVSNGVQTVNVYEIPYTGLNSGLRSDTVYQYKDPASDFNGNQVGSATYTIRNLPDSSTIINPGDTFKVANVVRIKLNNSIGTKLAQLDTSSGNGYSNDSLFRTFFNGLSIKADNSGNALSYFNLTDTATKLTVYYRYNLNGKDTTAMVEYHHSANGQSNYVNVQPGSNWASSLNNATADKVYIQSSPSGSYASVVIPFLDTLSNKVIHRAEIIATRVPSASDNIFTTPPQLLLDRYRTGSKDSAYLFEKDLILASDLTVGYPAFGGTLQNNQYHFDITRYVQGMVTNKQRNDTLRLWAPLRAYEYSSTLGYYTQIPVNSKVAEGRVVLGGGNYPDSTSRLRLRIVYSKL